MAVYKDNATGTWRVIYRFTNWKGERKQTQKRGFATKREAQAWEHEVMLKQNSKLDMTFASFFELYEADKKQRVKESTWESKSHVIRTKILPYFGNRKIAEIEAKDIIAWQNELMAYQDEKGKPYSADYLKTIHAQLTAIFNHAVNFYNLPYNPARRAGTMGNEIPKEMDFWTKEEYLKFSEAMMDKPRSFYAFEMLYWCGIRSGELLALTAADFDFQKQTVTISKTYHRSKGRDIITSPKTAKSNRTVKMPPFLCEEMQEYIKMLYDIKPDERLFTVTKSYLNHEMERGAKQAGVKKIRVHDIRHSHVSLLINIGFSVLAIGERVGHEAEKITTGMHIYFQLFRQKWQKSWKWSEWKRRTAMERSLDYKGRWRNHTVAFRVSDEEAKLLNDLVALSGLTKQEYIIRRLTCRDVVVQGNPRVYKALKNQMAAIHEELKRLETVSPDNDELLYTLQVIAITLEGLKGEDE